MGKGGIKEAVYTVYTAAQMQIVDTSVVTETIISDLYFNNERRQLRVKIGRSQEILEGRMCTN